MLRRYVFSGSVSFFSPCLIEEGIIGHRASLTPNLAKLELPWTKDKVPCWGLQQRQGALVSLGGLAFCHKEQRS